MEITKLRLKHGLEIARKMQGLEKQDYVFHFKEKIYLTPSGALLVALALKNLNESSSIELTGIESNSYAKTMRFFNTIDSEYGCNNNKKTGRYIPITRYSEKDIRTNEFQDLKIDKNTNIERIALDLSKILLQQDEEVIGEGEKALSYILREVLRNIPEHAKTNDMWICAQYWEKERRVEVAIADEGIGIFESIRSNMNYVSDVKSNEGALEYVLYPGVSESFTKNKKKELGEWDNSGFGLYVIKRLCEETGGIFCIASQNDYLLIEDSKQEKGKTNFNGTFISISLRVDRLEEVSELIKKIVKEGQKEAKKHKNRINKASAKSRS